MKENNKLIAEFMGLNIDNGVQSDYMEHELKYHKSWDWLMPVVDKIESIDEELQVFGGNFIKVSYSVQIENTSVTIWKHSDRFDSKRIIEVNGESKRRTTYNAVIEFINQYK